MENASLGSDCSGLRRLTGVIPAPQTKMKPVGQALSKSLPHGRNAESQIDKHQLNAITARNCASASSAGRTSRRSLAAGGQGAWQAESDCLLD